MAPRNDVPGKVLETKFPVHATKPSDQPAKILVVASPPVADLLAHALAPAGFDIVRADVEDSETDPGSEQRPSAPNTRDAAAVSVADPCAAGATASPSVLAIVAWGTAEPAPIGRIADLVRQAPDRPVLVVSPACSDAQVLESLRAGASGYLFLQDVPSRLASALGEALSGGAPMSRAVSQLILTRARRRSTQLVAVASGPRAPEAGRRALPQRKREILEMLSRGFRYDQIAAHLGISVNTVRTHVREIYEFLGVNNKVEAVMLAVEAGLIERR